ncbi:Ribokinase [Thermobacillus xylanilyticus]|uniref:Ribokinase n=1 Tax=Thermobacillus xylanilyticus TaxID=76633 RepID=A0ABN7RQD4_THEXY|nr:carbohydrate kinase family protein [Thermobacillus xylanilyticus]CAG5082762.1 Ribokinase [Thermobacillus xylanilyticus]
MKRPTILTFGNIVMDGLYRVESLPGHDEKVFASSAAWSPGGPAVHFALEAASLGLSSGVLGWIGTDAFGRQIEETLRRRGVSPLLQRVPEAPTPTAVVIVDRTGEKAVLLSPPIDRERLAEAGLPPGVDISAADHLHTHLFREELVLRVLDLAKRQGVTTSLDVEPSSVERWGTEAVRRALALTDIAFVNERAVNMLVPGGAGPETKLPGITASGPSIVVCTRASRGSVVCAPGRLITCPAIPVETVSSLGAGDIFSSVFVCALLSGKPPEEAAVTATAASAVSVSRSPDAVCYPTKDDIADMLEKSPVVPSVIEVGSNGNLHQR